MRSIGDHALIGNGRSAALVDRDGSIDWLCWPRFDSPSIFGSLLDERAGRFRIAPSAPARVSRRYLPHTAVLETRFERPDGTLLLVDFMPVASEKEKRGLLFPEHEIVRLAICERGEVEILVELAPRPEYGALLPTLRMGGRGRVCADLGRAALHFASDEPLAISADRASASARVRLTAGERRAFVLGWSHESPSTLPQPELALESLERTVRWWRSFSARMRWDGPWRDEIERSAITLKLMIYAPSGAIIAAPTTSLPERMGGSLNWDYRYCWLRDAALTTRALLCLGYEEDALAFGSWLLHATHLTLPELRVVYDVFGEHAPRERTLPLSGWRGSRPVRAGNDATSQRQLDLYGEVIESSWHLAEAGMPPDRESSGLLAKLAKHVIRHWREPDHGIWEIRGAPRHWTHSKALCGVALDRFAEMRARGWIAKGPDGIDESRADIRHAVESEGWSEALGSRVSTFGGTSVDAALLLLPLHGWEPARSPRAIGTWRAIADRLQCGPRLLRRNLEIDDGAFLACGFWAAEWLALAGAPDEARRWLEAGLARANDVGLLPEEADPWTGEPLGNFPQAWSHVALVCAATRVAALPRFEEAHP